MANPTVVKPAPMDIPTALAVDIQVVNAITKEDRALERSPQTSLLGAIANLKPPQPRLSE